MMVTPEINDISNGDDAKLESVDCRTVPYQQMNTNASKQSPISHRNPLHPRMGLQHLKCMGMSDCSNSSENGVGVSLRRNGEVNIDGCGNKFDECATKLLKKYSVSPTVSLSIDMEKNKCQDEWKGKNRIRQTLLNGMMSTTRQPMKARHSLYNVMNNDKCELTEVVVNKNQLLVTHDKSSSNGVDVWRKMESDFMECGKSTDDHVLLTAYPNEACRRRGICTVPGMKRRGCMENVGLCKSTGQRLHVDGFPSTTMKRSCIHESCTMETRPKYVNTHNDQTGSLINNANAFKCDHHSNDQSAITPNTSTTSNTNTNTSISYTSSSSSPVAADKRRSLPLKCRQRWGKITSKPFSRRCSTGSIKSVQSLIENEISENGGRHEDDPNLNTKCHRGSRVFRRIRRSAQRRLSDLCKVLKYSNSTSSSKSSSSCVNVVNQSDLKLDEMNQSTERWFECGPFNQSSTTLTLLCESSENVVDRIDRSVECDVGSINYPTLRCVMLSRRDFNAPFGLFVVKSAQGYRVTRLSERLIHDKLNNGIYIGDEIVQVNGIQCSDLDVNDLQELFRNHQSLVLTIINR
ncbi:PDZ DHR GLGF domain-containing-like protein [Schistosoma japonicum]|nr:PDZ DHR GLGF domain-containing-like protein [Schistosoma japonicum]KAH8861819.1 PDZ DHR GLGF domain-containing-like protein [Schistosoma japonicum]